MTGWDGSVAAASCSRGCCEQVAHRSCRDGPPSIPANALVPISYPHPPGPHPLLPPRLAPLPRPQARLFQALQGLRLRHRVLLTGTPLQNDLSELFMLLHFLEPQRFNSLGEGGPRRPAEGLAGSLPVLCSLAGERGAPGCQMTQLSRQDARLLWWKQVNFCPSLAEAFEQEFRDISHEQQVGSHQWQGTS